MEAEEICHSCKWLFWRWKLIKETNLLSETVNDGVPHLSDSFRTA